MEQAQVAHPPLTFSELDAMLARHMNNAEVTKFIKDAMERRLSEIGQSCLDNE